MPLWISQSLLSAIREQLPPPGEVILRVLGNGKLAKALEQSGFTLVSGAEASDAVIVSALHKYTEEDLQGWRQSMGRGGRLLSLDRGKATQVSNRLLCSGFSDIEQVSVGAGKRLSSARVCRVDPL